MLGVLPQGPAILQVGFQHMCTASFRMDRITSVLRARGGRATWAKQSRAVAGVAHQGNSPAAVSIHGGLLCIEQWHHRPRNIAGETALSNTHLETKLRLVVAELLRRRVRCLSCSDLYATHYFTYLAVMIPLLFVLYFTFSTSMGRVEDANRHLEH